VSDFGDERMKNSIKEDRKWNRKGDIKSYSF